MSKVQVVVGGQFGSEGKGAVAAWLANGTKRLAAVRVAGPNAGHSAVGRDGRKWALRQIPVMAVVNERADLYIAAGSEIDETVLMDEIAQLEKAGYTIADRLYIDGQATIINEYHQAAERGLMHGTTGKGIGSARADRIMRGAHLWKDGLDEEQVVNTGAKLRHHIYGGGNVIIEGTQGYGLGLHAGYYPFCTSSDCRAVDFLAMAGICPWWPGVNVETWVVLRSHPIRIAGNSGPLLGETTWAEVGVDPEYTTVTKKERRVGAWDGELARAAVAENGGGNAKVFLSFFDYWFPEIAGARNGWALTHEMRKRIEEIEDEIGCRVAAVGTGPDTQIVL